MYVLTAAVAFLRLPKHTAIRANTCVQMYNLRIEETTIGILFAAYLQYVSVQREGAYNKE